MPSLKRRQAAEPPTTGADWRAPLYFLNGEVYTDEDGETTVWKGTWVASEGTLPSLQEFDASEEMFELKSRDFLGTGVPLEVRCPIGRSGSFSGTYAQGDGRTFSDHVHRLCVLDHGEGCSLVAERGESSIGGEYVSIGRIVFPKGGRGLATLTLARRYITAADARTAMTPWQFVFGIAGQVSRASCREKDDFIPQALAPWKLLT
jgi:hypothetical protein